MASVANTKKAGSGFRISKRVLPYVLSLPALLVCIGILIPFFTAVINSFQRYRLSQPWARKFNWGENYLGFFTDASFWNTLKISLTYAFLTVTLELLLGLGIALLLQRRSTVNNFISIMLLLPLMIALSTRATGTIHFWNKVYEGAMGWTSELSKFGAHAFMADPHRIITFGGKPLAPAEVESPYIIRVAIALLMLATSIPGKSVIENATPVRRAHPRFAENITALGGTV